MKSRVAVPVSSVCRLCGGAYLCKSQSKELKKTLKQNPGYHAVDDLLKLHNARVDRDIKMSKREAAKIDSTEDVLNYVTHKAFSPDNENWSLVDNKYIRYT